MDWEPFETCPKDGSFFVAGWTNIDGEVILTTFAQWGKSGDKTGVDSGLPMPTLWKPLPKE